MSMKDVPSCKNAQPSTPRRVRWSLLVNAVALATILQVTIRPTRMLFSPQSTSHECRAPLPSFLATNAPSGAETPLKKAFSRLDPLLQRYFDQRGIDSLSVAVVGSEGSLYEGFWGTRRANESSIGEDTTVDRHSIYRLASISKLFTALETLILRDRGVLKLDDPVSSVCPEFRYNKYYAPITFRALMSHMSGLGSDLPPGNAQGHWPKSLVGRGPPLYNGLEFPSHQEVFDGIAKSRPVVAPYTYPVYSNTGYSLLGMANVAANIAESGPSEPNTHAELVQRDIFGPLGCNGSSFLVTEENIHNVVVPSLNSWEIDQDFKDAINPAGGQMSSLSDLTKLMQVLINPQRPESVLSPFTVREWMRPIHTWYDDYSAVGALWEIYTSTDSYDRKQKLYQKLGELPGYHTAFTLNPVNSYGIIVLQSGPTSETIELTKLITSHVQAAFDRVLEDVARHNLAGTWRSMDGLASLTVEINRGSLYVNEYTINGTDVLRVMQNDQASALTRLPLWPTGDDQYRLVVPMSNEGCFYSWVMLDAYGYIGGVSTNVIVSETRNGGERVLFLPAVNAELRK
ncbi:beta-lactamase/transpeptidase-like protein [Boletus edulis]|nr:beta-lactamase/transpeptidase-like protein [Boletus edulis]KAF8120924.1 beta-lactamase/transpeptidase-like protein [Boletus edulis]